MTLQEKQILLAEFLGWKYYPKVKIMTHFYDCELHKLNDLDEDDVWIVGVKPEFEKYLCTSPAFYDINNIEKPYDDYHYSLKFNSDWNWIIKVVEKIENLDYDFIISNKTANVWTKTDFNCITDNSKDENRYSSKLEAVFEACVQFVEWYNKNKS